MHQNDLEENCTIKAKIRLDYQGTTVPKRFWVGRKSSEEISEEIRDQQALGLRNLAFQGVRVEEVDQSTSVYNVKDPISEEETSFAPAIVTLEADTLEDLVDFAMREEFRKVDIISPDSLCLSGREVGRLLAAVNRKMRENVELMSRQMEKS